MKVGLFLIILGLFLIRSSVEDIMVKFFPGDLEILIGVGLIGYGMYRFHQNKYDWQKLWRMS